MKKVTHKTWRVWEEKYLRDNYCQMTQAELARKLDRTRASICLRAMRMGLRKENPTLFKKGQVSPTAGKRKKPHPNQGGHTRFAPGHKPHNTLLPGVHLVKYHDKQIYMIKHADGAREPYAHHIWKQAHGAIPEGHVIAFKDYDPMNCKLDNLLCLSRADHFALLRRERMNWSEVMKRAWRSRKGLSVVDAVLNVSL